MPIQTGFRTIRPQQPSTALADVGFARRRIELREKENRQQQFQKSIEAIGTAYKEMKEKEKLKKQLDELKKTGEYDITFDSAGAWKAVPKEEKETDILGMIAGMRDPTQLPRETLARAIPTMAEGAPVQAMVGGQITPQMQQAVGQRLGRGLGVTPQEALRKKLGLPQAKEIKPTIWDIQKEARMNINAMITNNFRLQSELMKNPQKRITMLNDEVKRLSKMYKVDLPTGFGKAPIPIDEDPNQINW